MRASGADVLHGHVSTAAEAPSVPCHSRPLPTSPRAALAEVFPHLPLSALAGALPSRVHSLLHERAHGETPEARARATLSLHSLAALNDALGRVLNDDALILSSEGVPLRGADALSQLAEV